MDTINSPIRYSFLSGTPTNYKDFFEINPTSGAVRQIRAVDTAVTKRFDIIIRVRFLIVIVINNSTIYLASVHTH